MNHPAERPHADIHANLFWSYGNAELENNCTRALVVTLSACGTATTARFLRAFAGSSGRPPFTLALQAAPQRSVRAAPGATILALTTTRVGAVEQRIGPLPGKRRSSRRDYATRAIPDAWILDAEGRVALLIESKLGPTLDRDQLERHWRAHLGPPVPKRFRSRSWEDVAGFLERELREHPLNPSARFVARGFLEYLDLLGLRPFRTFRAHHFVRGDLRDGFQALLEVVRALPGRARGWTTHPWTEPDADLRSRPGLGNTGLAFWEGVDGLAIKLALGARAKSDVEHVLAQAQNARWRQSLRKALAGLGPFTAEVKVRAQFAQANCYVPVRVIRGATGRHLDDLLSELMNCHKDDTWDRQRLRRWLRGQGVAADSIEASLDDHQRFNVYGHLLLFVVIPGPDLVDKDLVRVAKMVSDRLDAMEAVRQAFSASST